MMYRLKRFLKWSLFLVLAVVLLTVGQDEVHFNPADRAAAAYRYDLIRWEFANFLSKWAHRASSAMPWSDGFDGDRRELVRDYFDLGLEMVRLESLLDRTVSTMGQDYRRRVMELEEALDDIRSSRNRLRNDVEEAIESTISSVISDFGLGSWGELVFPPVDIRLTEPPKVLVTSRRDRIERIYEVILKPTIKIAEREEVERELLDGSDLAGLVLDIGGLATFPAFVRNDRPLRGTLQSAAHEWLHHYFFFRPLGWHMFGNADMRTLNETAADLAGREIGAIVFQRLTGGREREPHDQAIIAADGSSFDFDREMRKIRLQVDELLNAGMVAEAEAYMEERRKHLVANGARIRKLNQAYFAFFGTYAENAASVSPIGDQLHELRDLVPDVGAFVSVVSMVSSYEELLDKLEELRASRAP